MPLMTTLTLFCTAFNVDLPSAPKIVAVTGATGRLGRLGVQRLVAGGYQVKALLRHDVSPGIAPSAAPDAPPPAVAAYLASLPGVELVKGDVTDKESVDRLLAGTSACLALHGARRMRKYAAPFYISKSSNALDVARCVMLTFSGSNRDV
jgi:uncharacterized protein YbjT (DUF2867 family)